MFCGNCGYLLDADSVFCSKCGAKVSTNLFSKFCSDCGTKLEENAIFCVNCGVKVHEIETNSEEKTVVDKVKINETCESTKQPPINKEYKNLFTLGRHFVYIDDTSKVFCPKCHKRTDINATLCSNCNTSFMVATKSSSDKKKSWQVQKIDFKISQKTNKEDLDDSLLRFGSILPIS